MKFNELTDMMQKPEPKPDTYEAGMALNQLLKIGTHAIKIHNMIDDDAEMEAWVAKKIDLASNYVKSVHGYTAGSKAGTYDDDGMSEGKDTPATDKEIKMAKGIAFDKRYKDNYTGASNTIEKVKKGLSQQPDVADALKRANEDVGYPRPLDGEVAVKQFAKNNPDTKFLLVKKSNGKFRVSYSMDITPGGHKGPGEPSSTVSGGTNEFDNANDAIEAGKKNAADYHKERMAQLKEPHEEEPIHPLYGDWGTTPEDWSDTHVANNDDIIIAIAKGKIPPKPVTLSGYMDEQNDEWPEGVEGGKYNDDQIVSMIEDTIGYECRGLGYDYFSRITFGEEKGMYKPTPEMIKRAQEIVKDPEFAKARARNRGQAESVSEDAGEGHMSKSQLYQTAKMAIELLDMIRKGDDLEGWVQTKLNLAADYLQAVYHYEDYQKLNPYREEIDGSLIQRHAGIIQKHLDEILERKCRTEDVDTKPGMMRILKKRVNEVEKEIAKENRKETNEDQVNEDPRAVGRALANLKYGKAMANAIMKGEDMVLLRPKAQAYLGSIDQTIELLDKMYPTANRKESQETTEAVELDEGIREWGKRLAMAGIIVAGLAGVNSINNAIDNSVPAVKAMNTALEMAQDSGNDELAKMIEKDLSDAKVRLSSGKDLTHVADLQDKYAKFMKTEGMAYESKLAVNLKQRLK